MTTTAQEGRKATQQGVFATLGMFDEFGSTPTLRMVWEGVSITDAPKLRRGDYAPRGGTPLIDATMAMIGKLAGAMSENPEGVHIGLLADESGSMGGNEVAVVQGVNDFVDGMRDTDAKRGGRCLLVILTDGLENSSRETTSEQLRAEIRKREAEGWAFLYLGANQDSWGESRKSGFSGAAGAYANYKSTPSGLRGAMASSTRSAQAFTQSSGSTADFYAENASIMPTDIPEDEKGDEKDDNPPPPPQPFTSAAPTFGNVDDALRKAKETTE